MKIHYSLYVWSILLSFFFFDAIFLYASELPSKPVLRIESGMHTAPINRISLDSDNRYLVTASDDKTVGVWEASTGRRIKTLRPPIGEGNEGKLYAVAISADGSTVAAGGYTQAGESSFNIYLFDRSTGRLAQKIPGLPNAIAHLAYSKDGRYLVACLGGKNGIRLYRTSDYSLIGKDNNYGDSAVEADFDSHERLVTVSLDGYIRLYKVGAGNTPLRLIAKEKGRGGAEPSSVSISPSSLPEETRVAVGYSDSIKVDVLSGNDLSYLYSPDTTVGNKRAISIFSQVTWSSDGSFLYGGGGMSKGKVIIRKWTDNGKEKQKDIFIDATHSIMQLMPLKNGGIAFGTADPTFGIINAADENTVFYNASIIDYKYNQEEFFVSHDGSTVQFGYEPTSKVHVSFSIKERLLLLKTKLDMPEPDDDDLTFSKGFGDVITDWKTETPKLNGIALTLSKYEQAVSFNISQSGERVLLGTNKSLRLFNRKGTEKWTIPVPGVPWSVKISGNSKVAVAAFGDGTIRWYSMERGKELLALFTHKDRKRWVIWNPRGYYDASAGAEELIGWHVNQGKDREADFFSASRFRAGFYRPEFITHVLEEDESGIVFLEEDDDEDKAVKHKSLETSPEKQELTIRQQLPPVVSIITPSDNAQIQSAEITIRYTVRTPSGEPVTAIKTLVDGRPVPSGRGITIKSKEGETNELRISVPERDSEISVIAENRYSTSEPSTIRVRWTGQKKEYIIKPKLYVLSIGVSDYQNKDLTLKYPAKDAKDFAEAMSKQKGMLYKEVVTKVLVNSGATKDDILDGLDWIKKETTSKDVAMVFIAGHGVNDQNSMYYYLPANANLDKLMRTGVAFSDIKNTVASLAGKTVLFVDTCHSGNVMGSRRGSTDINAVVNELSSVENGAVVFASSTGKQYSLEDDNWNNGAFTKALVEGVTGKADYTGEGRITINMLDLYLSDRVKELTGGKQTPTTTKPNTIPDFPIAVKR